MWPNVGIKSCPIFTQSCHTEGTIVFNFKKSASNFAQYLGRLLIESLYPRCLKNSQSGHAAQKHLLTLFPPIGTAALD